jgi:hypothetical protein
MASRLLSNQSEGPAGSWLASLGSAYRVFLLHLRFTSSISALFLGVQTLCICEDEGFCPTGTACTICNKSSPFTFWNTLEGWRLVLLTICTLFVTLGGSGLLLWSKDRYGWRHLRGLEYRHLATGRDSLDVLEAPDSRHGTVRILLTDEKCSKNSVLPLLNSLPWLSFALVAVVAEEKCNKAPISQSGYKCFPSCCGLKTFDRWDVQQNFLVCLFWLEVSHSWSNSRTPETWEVQQKHVDFLIRSKRTVTSVVTHNNYLNDSDTSFLRCATKIYIFPFWFRYFLPVVNSGAQWKREVQQNSSKSSFWLRRVSTIWLYYGVEG